MSVRTGEVDSLRAVLEGERSHSESERKSQAVGDGLRRRKEKGKPVGAIPLGYRVEHLVLDDEPTTRRVVDPAGAALYARIVADAERGMSPGTISRALNGEGHRTTRGKPWTTRAVRRVLENADYVGGTGYPALIDAAAGTGSGPAPPDGRGRRPGAEGRSPGPRRLPLAGVAFCSLCGAPMRAGRYRTGTRVYRCRNGMEGIGLCEHAVPIAATVVEPRVIAHLERVADDQLRRWLADRAEQHRRERDARSEVVGG